MSFGLFHCCELTSCGFSASLFEIFFWSGNFVITLIYELIKLLDNPGNSVSVLNLRFKKCGDTLRQYCHHLKHHHPVGRSILYANWTCHSVYFTVVN
jgi:hypothetical protein